MIEILQAHSQTDLESIRELFREYQSSQGVEICFKNFDVECANLPGEYAPPRGRLFLARQLTKGLGCVALRPFSANTCEMKRLYVRPTARGEGLGQRLVELTIHNARLIGYKQLVLDTLPTMDRAQRLYERMGFVEISAYQSNPVVGTKFLGLDL